MPLKNISIKSRNDILFGRNNFENIFHGKYVIIGSNPTNRQNHKVYKSSLSFYRTLFVVTKKNDKRAVIRNRIRRRLKEAFQKTNPNLLKSNYDYQIIAKKNIIDVKFNDLIMDIEQSLSGHFNQCIFCNVDKNDVIYETENFYVKIGKAIITAGHIMIIPKKHFPCIAAIGKNIINEYLDLKKMVGERVEEIFSKPLFAEYGIFGQSVRHAHVHLIPSKTDFYSSVELLNQLVRQDSQILNADIISIDNFEDLINYYNKNRQYVYYELDNKQYIIATNNTMKSKEDDIGYRKYFSKILKGVSNWSNMSKEDKAIDAIKINETKSKLYFY